MIAPVSPGSRLPQFPMNRENSPSVARAQRSDDGVLREGRVKLINLTLDESGMKPRQDAEGLRPEKPGTRSAEDSPA